MARYGAKPKAQKRVLDRLAARGVEATLSPTHTFVIAKLLARRAAHSCPRPPGDRPGPGRRRARGWGSLEIPAFAELALRRLASRS